jgi:hypothetical protein
MVSGVESNRFDSIPAESLSLGQFVVARGRRRKTRRPEEEILRSDSLLFPERAVPRLVKETASPFPDGSASSAVLVINVNRTASFAGLAALIGQLRPKPDIIF